MHDGPVYLVLKGHMVDIGLIAGTKLAHDIVHASYELESALAVGSFVVKVVCESVFDERRREFARAEVERTRFNAFELVLF